MNKRFRCSRCTMTFRIVPRYLKGETVRCDTCFMRFNHQKSGHQDGVVVSVTPGDMPNRGEKLGPQTAASIRDEYKDAKL